MLLVVLRAEPAAREDQDHRVDPVQLAQPAPGLGVRPDHAPDRQRCAELIASPPRACRARPPHAAHASARPVRESYAASADVARRVVRPCAEPGAAEVIPVPTMIAQPEPGGVHLCHPEIRAGDEVDIGRHPSEW